MKQLKKLIFIFAILLLISCICCEKKTSKKNIIFQMRFIADHHEKNAEEFIIKGAGKKYTVSRIVQLDQDDIQSAVIDSDEFGNDAALITFNAHGAMKLCEATGPENYGKEFGTIINDNLLNVDVIKFQVCTGKALLHGNLSRKELREIIDKLND